MTANKSVPTLGAERIDALDAIRGFALFGVLLVNLYWHGDMAMPAAVVETLPTARADRSIGFVITWLASGKAQALFSMLFGFGFAVFMERLNNRGANAARLYWRRAAVLLAIGFAHLYLVWTGDILHAYALLAFILPLVRKWPSRLLLAAGLLLSLTAYPILDLYLSTTVEPGGKPALHVAWEQGRTFRYDAFLSGDYGAYVRELARSNDDEFIGTIFYPAYLAFIFGRFLIGYWIFRRGWLQDAASNAALLRRSAPWLLGGGLSLGLVSPVIGTFELEPHAGREFAVGVAIRANQLLLALGYAAALTLLWLTPAWRARLGALAAVGRMALTNYLLQSVVYILLLYGFGFGWLRFAGATVCLAVAIVVFAMQLAFSRWWLARFRFGPAEWLWRSATYGRWQPFRLSPSGVAAEHASG